MSAKTWLENLKVRDHSEGLGVDLRIILKLTFREIGFGGVGWTNLAQDRGWWKASVNTV
jgi:hypothetical protein